MTALDDAARAVAEARRDVCEWLYPLAASTADKARAAVDRLEAAVRAHDAEIVRADTGHIRYGSATEYAIRHAALIHPDSPMSKTGPEEQQ